MNTYIQAIVDKYDKAGCFIEWETTFSKEDLQDALTDYHNHIVEKIVKDVDMTDQQLQDILSILQDTNPKE